MKYLALNFKHRTLRAVSPIYTHNGVVLAVCDSGANARANVET